MFTRQLAAPHPVTGSGLRARHDRTGRVDLAAPLGPFVVRRFVDYARTKSMMCRSSF